MTTTKRKDANKSDSKNKSSTPTKDTNGTLKQQENDVKPIKRRQAAAGENVGMVRNLTAVALFFITLAGLKFQGPISNFMEDVFQTTHDLKGELFQSGRNKVLPILHGYHFEDVVRDTPWDFRPPSLILFHSDQCEVATKKYNFGTRGMPGRQDLLMGTFDMGYKNGEFWYELEDEMDLAKRFNVKNCPQLVIVSRDYALENRTATVELYTGGAHNWKSWVAAKLKIFGTNERSADWTESRLLTRDSVETGTHTKITKIPPQLPHFTEHGWMKRKMPDGLHDRLKAFYKKHEKDRSVEQWGTIGTQTNFHEHPMTLVYLDLDAGERDRIAKTYVKPVVEEWSNLKNLKLNAFYGIREYYRGSELRTHIDRTDTHVISAILNIDQIGLDEPWYLEVIDFNGTRLQLDMEPGDMVLYESATLPHGRPLALKGDRYVNAFCHFAPRDWDYTLQGNEGIRRKSGNKQSLDPLPRLQKSSCPVDDPNSKSVQVAGAKKSSVVFRNASGEDLEAFWVDANGNESSVGNIDVDEDLSLGSYEGHVFKIRFTSDNALAQEVTIESTDVAIGIGGCPRSPPKIKDEL